MKKTLFAILLLIFAHTLTAQQEPTATSLQTESSGFKLSQNYPNPAKDYTHIRLQVNSSGTVSLKLYDMTGNLVSSLIEQHLTAGIYSVPVETGNIPDGVYFYVLKKDSLSQTMKMIISK